jgi:hypothetical protein
VSDEISAGGSRIYRHEQAAPSEFVAGDEGVIDAVTAHVERHFGPVDHVFHEIVSTHVHVDLLLVMPRKERPVITVVTSGMSARPMRGGLYGELMLILPPSWPTEGPAFEAEEGYWPFRLLKFLARLPHEYDTRLWVGDTVPNGDPPAPYASNTKLCGALIAPMLMPNDEGAETIVYDGHEINLMAVLPLHADEMQLKLDKGADRGEAHRDRGPGSSEHRPATEAPPLRPLDAARAAAALDAPADDPLRVDADQRRRHRDRLGPAADLDPARVPGVGAREVVDDDRRAAGACGVAKLLGQLELVAADVDGVARGVVEKGDRDHVRRAVGADRREAAELPAARQVGALGVGEHAHRSHYDCRYRQR